MSKVIQMTCTTRVCIEVFDNTIIMYVKNRPFNISTRQSNKQYNMPLYNIGIKLKNEGRFH